MTLTYRYDLNNRMTEEARTEGGITLRSSYAYDKAGQLTSFRRSDGYAEAYTYDPVGNMVEKVLNATKIAMTYDAANELKTMESPHGTLVYAYDLNGNLTQKTLGDRTDTYSYDARNHLKQYRGYDNYTVKYSYNALGMLHAKESSGNHSRTTLEELIAGKEDSDDPDGDGEAHRTTYVYDLTRPYYEVLTETTDGEVTSYTYGLERLAAYADDTRTAYLYDGRGSVIQTRGSLGTQTMAYSAFGELLTGKVSGFGYNGEYYDAATGMLNLRARQYEPAQARFSQRDSLKGSAASPRSLNAYLYCQNDAINFFDASGAAMMAVNMTDGGGGRKSDTSPSNFFRKANQTIKTAVTRAVNSAAEAAKAAQQSALTQAQISSILKESRNPANVWEKARANRAQAQASTPTVSGRSFLRSTPLTACMTQEEYDDYWIIYGVDMPFDTPSPTPQPTPKPMSPSTSLTEQIYAARKEPNRTKRIIKTTSVFINAVIHAIKDDVDDVDLTYSDGITGSLSPTGVFAYSGSLFVSFDTKGNVAIQYSKDGAIMTGDVSISASGFGSITNAPTVDDLNGPYYSIGGSYATIIEGIPIYAGGDAIIMYNAEMDEYYVGALERVGVANPGAEFHVSWGETGTLWEINIVDCIDQINEMILEW